MIWNEQWWEVVHGGMEFHSDMLKNPIKSKLPFYFELLKISAKFIFIKKKTAYFNNSIEMKLRSKN